MLAVVLLVLLIKCYAWLIMVIYIYSLAQMPILLNATGPPKNFPSCFDPFFVRKKSY